MYSQLGLVATSLLRTPFYSGQALKSRKTRITEITPTLRDFLYYTDIKAPSTLMRFCLKMHTSRYVFPCVHTKTIRKHIQLKTLSKVETFEKASFRIRIAFSVDDENGGL